MFYIVVGIIITCLITYYNLPSQKGKRGERVVSSALCKLPIEQYQVLNNVILQTQNGTTQIDHIVVSSYGIFVIETKNYIGWITGGEYSEQWVQNIYGSKYPFYNPLRQNYGHIKALQNILRLKEDVFIPIVTFSSRCEIKVHTSKPVLYFSQVDSFIQSFTEVVINPEDLNLLVGKILLENKQNRSMDRKHVKNVRRNVSEKDMLRSLNVCPRCGGELKKRQGKYGEFYGCSGYPRCRYTRKG